MHISLFFFFNDTATTEIYTLSLHDALPISLGDRGASDDRRVQPPGRDPESGATADRSGDLDGRRVQLHAGATRIRVRPDVHQLGGQDDREPGSPDRTGPGRRVPLGAPNGGP